MTLSVELVAAAEEGQRLIDRLRTGLPIMADLCRSDLLLCRSLDYNRGVVLFHARPHSVSPVRPEDQTGRIVTRDEEPLVMRVLHHPSGGIQSGEGNLGAPIRQEVWPVQAPSGEMVGALCVETTVVEVARHRKRSQVFQEALRQLQHMLVRGELDGCEGLTPFGEHDGIVFVDMSRRIRYVSGVAENLYRKLGHAESLLGHFITDLGTDEGVYFAALDSGRCVEAETREGQLIWIRKGIPVRAMTGRTLFAKVGELPGLSGVLMTVSDVTEERRREQQLRVKAAMIQEIHHRVKNNLQTIASLLRMQGRRVGDPAARVILEEGVNRILSVAVVHEFLSHDEGHVISIREVAQRIVNHTMQGILAPGKGINLSLQGGGFKLSAQQATACALVINELVQNAVEHGYADRVGGTIVVNLLEDGNDAVIEVVDDGEGLPPDFDLDHSSSLGLKIVQTLVKEDLKGTFELSRGEGEARGVRAFVRFPRLPISEESQAGLH